MVYRKNITSWEQVLRVVAGVPLTAYGLLGLAGLPYGYAVAATGLSSVVSGMFGFCPGCALVGRRLADRPAAVGADR